MVAGLSIRSNNDLPLRFSAWLPKLAGQPGGEITFSICENIPIVGQLNSLALPAAEPQKLHGSHGSV